MNGSQQKILDMIRCRGQVRSREIIREIPGWDFRKAICRLQKKGYPIVNMNPPGIEAVYVWKPQFDLPLFKKKENENG